MVIDRGSARASIPRNEAALTTINGLISTAPQLQDNKASKIEVANGVDVISNGKNGLDKRTDGDKTTSPLLEKLNGAIQLPPREISAEG